MSDNEKAAEIKGKLTPAKMIQDIESSLKQEEMKKLREEAKKMVTKVADAKKTAVSAVRLYQAAREELVEYEATLTAALADFELEPDL